MLVFIVVYLSLLVLLAFLPLAAFRARNSKLSFWIWFPAATEVLFFTLWVFLATTPSQHGWMGEAVAGIGVLMARILVIPLLLLVFLSFPHPTQWDLKSAIGGGVISLSAIATFVIVHNL